MADKTPTKASNTGSSIEATIGKEVMESLEVKEKPNEKAPQNEVMITQNEVMINDAPIKTMPPHILDQIEMKTPKSEKCSLKNADAIIQDGAANEPIADLDEMGRNVCGESAPVEPMQTLRHEIPNTCEKECLKISEIFEEAILDDENANGDSPKKIDTIGAKLGDTDAAPPLQAEQQQQQQLQLSSPKQPQAVAANKNSHSAPVQMVVTNGNPYCRDFDNAGYFGLPNVYHPELTTRIGYRKPDYFYTQDGSVHFYQPKFFEYKPGAGENQTIIVSKNTETSRNDEPKNIN